MSKTDGLRKRLLKRLGAFFLRLVKWHFSRGTPEQAEQRGRKLGRLVGRIDKRRINTAISNLELALPELEDREGVARRVFENFGMTTADFLREENRDLERIESTTEIVGREHLDACIAEGKGTLLITGHLGNWERAAVWISAQHPLSVIARTADDADTDQMVNEVRKTGGYKVIPRGDSARQILTALKTNQILGILCDQNAQDIYIPFFGHPAGTVNGPGAIAEKAGCPLLPMACVRTGPCRYRIEFFPHFHAPPRQGEKGEATMRRINAWLEDVIRLYPDQWLWIHDRWRSARRRGML